MPDCHVVATPWIPFPALRAAGDDTEESLRVIPGGLRSSPGRGSMT
ncbi:hypothetical protein C7450_105137 [Chelatococcus asaccharovorans]|uniref:Uncharacterized protein n=1 Tax=Chelatococcus asaccharovorans TaxID=28210 RepID=A0A2V3U7E3_9HYPH|nr:hypothetical protein C7450_105137 [Chelatococcus asaccharovorans]